MISKQVKALLNEQIVEVPFEDGFDVIIRGFEEIVFQSVRNENIYYIVKPLNSSSRAEIEIQLAPVNRRLALDRGNLKVAGMRKRIVKEVKKRFVWSGSGDDAMTWRDWKIPELVEQELETIASVLPDWVAYRDRHLLHQIRDGDDDEVKARLEEALKADGKFSDKTEELLDALEYFPEKSTGPGASQERFSRQDLAGAMPATIDAVRHRMSPLRGRGIIDVVQQGRGNQPTYFQYHKKQRATKHDEQKGG